MVLGLLYCIPNQETLNLQTAEGQLDINLSLKEFQKFWKRNSEKWEEVLSKEKNDLNYAAAFPHIFLTAFLQRILNGGGRIEREYAAGRGRMDMAIEYGKQLFVIEIKLLRDNDTSEIVLKEGVKQIRAYRDKVGPDIPSYLIIFDRRSEAKKLPWEQRIQWHIENEITVLGC
jgi:hypothetical protein